MSTAVEAVVPVVASTTPPCSYGDAAAALWGEAGALAHDAYRHLRPLYPELPEQLPIVIGITAYGGCLGATRTDWHAGPRITLSSSIFRQGHHAVEDVVVHEMLHAWLAVTGRATKHDTAAWYGAVRRLSPAVLGHEVDIRRGAGRRSERLPNPAYEAGNGEPKTVVRKVRVAAAVPHRDVARWPQAFRPAGFDWGEVIPCPSY